METMDLIGWAAFGTFCTGAVVVVLLIRASHRRLGRILEREASLRRIDPEGAEMVRLLQALSAVQPGMLGRDYTLESVHKLRDGEIFLFTLIQVIKRHHAGGRHEKRYRDSDVCLGWAT